MEINLKEFPSIDLLISHAEEKHLDLVTVSGVTSHRCNMWSSRAEASEPVNPDKVPIRIQTLT